jgi:pyruvyltransferase
MLTVVLIIAEQRSPKFTILPSEYKPGFMQFLDGTTYLVSEKIVRIDNAIPLTYWTVTPNFGDLLSPYLVEKISGSPVKSVPISPGHKWKFSLKRSPFSYLAIGSIISRANAKSVVWGSGAFGTETKSSLNKKAEYRAVRGPLTRNLLRIHGINCPEVYGDPALLLPLVINPPVKKQYKVGVIIRWAETSWNSTDTDSDVKKIYLGTNDIESTIADILSCERIISSSLHGIILADAYRIPSAWLSSMTPKGLEFKFYDYFLSVAKFQRPQHFDFSVTTLKWDDISRRIKFNEQIIDFDAQKLLETCPFVDLEN